MVLFWRLSLPLLLVLGGTSADNTVQCPLSSSIVIRSSSDLCSSSADCESGKDCHPVGPEGHKACCDVDPEFLCPGGLFPRKVQKKLYSTEGDIKCDDGTFQYKWGTGDTPADIALCCPKVVSLELLVDRKRVAPVRPEETCQRNGDCKEDEFCGTSTLEENLDNPKMLEVNGARVNHCYKRPLCAGTTVLDPNVGLKTCSKAYNHCGTDEICDVDLGKTNQGRFRGSGVCCHFSYSGSVPEGKVGDTGKAGKACNCQGETKTQAFCDKELQNDENTINVCEATGVEGTYRQCTYAREALKCDIMDFEGALRRKDSFEVVPCSSHVDCQGASKQIDGGASLCISPLNPTTITKICCKADLCPDLFTFRANQKTCTNDDTCAWTEGNLIMPAKCLGDILGKSTAKHCCPSTAEIAGKLEVVYPFDTKTPCTSLEPCFGDNRFCDTQTGTCVYNWGTNPVKKSGSCTKDQRVCGADHRVVCMTSEVADTTSDPECYRHPLDQCETNKECKERGVVKYCAPQILATALNYDKAFRKCHLAATGAVIDESSQELKECKKTSDCNNADISCILTDSTAAVTPGFGYCKRNFEMTCHGSTTVDPSNGGVFPCSRNSDCGENDFCDMEIDRPQSIPGDKGICCSRPICGGDLVLKEAGVKICTEDTGCSAEEGEICIKDIGKPEGSAWKAAEGVCCKGTCPRIHHPEASETAVVAGPICEADNCQNTTDTIRLCVGGLNATYQRCCSYPRKAKICPSETSGPVRNGFDAKQCVKAKDCPKASECLGGFCCKQNFCLDGKTVKTAQLKCSNNSVNVDCKQPSGATASCDEGRCCPKTSNGKVLDPFVTTTPCRSAKDCPFNMMFCEANTKNCTFFGNRLELNAEKQCEKGNSSCVKEGLIGVCLYTDDNRNQLPSCYLDPMNQRRIQEEEKVEGKETSMVLGTILGIVAMGLATVGLGVTLLAGYYKVSRKNVREKMRKAEEALNKDKKKTKKEKTGQSEMGKNETSQKSQLDQSQMSQIERPGDKDGKSQKEESMLITM